MSALAEIHPPEPVAGSSPHLALRDLRLSQGGRIWLDQVCLAVGQGELVAVLGPQNSGKAALIEWLAGLCRAERGAVSFDGTTSKTIGRSARRKIGFVLPTPSLDPEATCRGNLVLAAELFGIPRAEAQERADDLLTYFGLGSQVEEVAGSLPAATGRVVELARALIHDPDLVVLGDPFMGVPPPVVDSVWRRFCALRRVRETSVLVCTSNLELASACQRVVVLDRGRVIADADPEILLSEVGPEVVVVESLAVEQLAVELAQSWELQPRVELGRNRLLLEVQCGHLLIPKLVEAFAHMRFDSITVRPADLADFFARRTGVGFFEPRW